jgi:hypothetical protein
MVREARRAGLVFDEEKVREMGCMDDQWETEYAEDRFPQTRRNTVAVPQIQIFDPDQEQSKPKTNGASHDEEKKSDGHDDSLKQKMSNFAQHIHDSATQGKIHDCLAFNQGLSHGSVIAWNIMEYLPFRRMDLQPDGSWKPIRWPLPGGEVRDIPEDAKIHYTVLRRMQHDPTYRPGNLIVGGGGRGVRVAPEEYGIGEWVVVQDEGCSIGEVLMKKSAWEKLQSEKPESETSV